MDNTSGIYSLRSHSKTDYRHLHVVGEVRAKGNRMTEQNLARSETWKTWGRTSHKLVSVTIK